MEGLGVMATGGLCVKRRGEWKGQAIHNKRLHCI